MAKKLTFKQVKRFVKDHIENNNLGVNDRYKKHYIDRLKEITGLPGLITIVCDYYDIEKIFGCIILMNLMMVDKKKKK